MSKQKLCSRCKKNNRSWSKHGNLKYYCLECEREKATEWRNNNPVKRLLSYAKSRAFNRGLEFSITVEDLPIPERCPILNIEFDFSLNGKAKPNSLSSHRLDSNKGYVKGNVILCSWRANDLIKDMTLEEASCIFDFLNK